LDVGPTEIKLYGAYAQLLKTLCLVAGLVSMILAGCAIQLGDVLFKRFQRAAIAHQLGKIKIKSFGVLVLLLLSSCLARSAPITDVGLGTWRYDAQTHLVTVPILNSSQKSLTAFNLSLKVTAGGTVSEYQSGRDFLSVALLQERCKDTPKEAFGTANISPGGVYEEKLGVPADFENITIVLDMVAFSDKTAEATNVPALERLVQKRKAIAASIEKASEVIAASAPETAANAVHQAKETWKAQEHTALTEDETQYLIIEQDLKQTPPESVKDYVAIKQKEQAVWLEQSQLRLIGGRP
jgi:hypothetical protein